MVYLRWIPLVIYWIHDHQVVIFCCISVDMENILAALYSLSNAKRIIKTISPESHNISSIMNKIIAVENPA